MEGRRASRAYGKGIAGFQWTINNKYYTAEVEIMDLDLEAADEAAVKTLATAPQPSVEALVCLVDGGDEARMFALNAWVENVLTVHDPEVRLVIDVHDAAAAAAAAGEEAALEGGRDDGGGRSCSLSLTHSLPLPLPLPLSLSVSV